MDRDSAEVLAIKVIEFLAADTDLLDAFMGMAGLSFDDLRSSIGSPELAAGVLDHLLANENLLLRFCDEQGIPPEFPARARRLLPGAVPEL